MNATTRILEIKRQHPDLTAAAIAGMVGKKRTYVNAVLQRHNLSAKAIKEKEAWKPPTSKKPETKPLTPIYSYAGRSRLSSRYSEI